MVRRQFVQPAYSPVSLELHRSRAHSSFAALLLCVGCVVTPEVEPAVSQDEVDASLDSDQTEAEQLSHSDAGASSVAETTVTEAGVQNVENVRISGFAQKGPFLNGANLTLSELNLTLAPTGRTFQTTIVDDTGAFSFQNVTLDNSIATIRVDGFFFNEVFGTQSESQITLSAITDLAARDSANINLVSHLEKARVEYLINSGATYAAAKQQALNEVFAAFSQQFATSEGITVSEELDLTQPGINNAGLLAISSILLGYRADASFSEILANVAGDLRTDGTLDSTSVLGELVGHARTLDADEIRTHLAARYEQLGQSVNVPSFGGALDNFVNAHTNVPQGTLFDYPAGTFLAELFAGFDGMVLQDARQEVAVDKAGAPMQMILTSIDGGGWGYALGGSGFLVTDFDYVSCTQTYELTVLDGKSSVDLEFSGGVYRADVYEGSLTTPAWSREFSFGPAHVGGCGGRPGVKDEEVGVTSAPPAPTGHPPQADAGLEAPPDPGELSEELPEPPPSHQPPPPPPDDPLEEEPTDTEGPSTEVLDASAGSGNDAG